LLSGCILLDVRDGASMFKKYRVTGLVSYQVDKGMRLAIPAGQIVDVDETEFEEGGHRYVASMTWTDSNGKQWREKWTAGFWTQLVRTQVQEVQ
jgi:hypothetical protein